MTQVRPQNVIVTRDVPTDATETAIIAKYDALSAPWPTAHRPISAT